MKNSAETMNSSQPATTQNRAERPAGHHRALRHHQPSFTAALTGLPPSDRALHKTFYAIEISKRRVARRFGGSCHVPRGLPVDVDHVGRASAVRSGIRDQGGPSGGLCRAYFASESVRKKRFHRALVEAGMVDLA
ncbi:hypothetical protein FJW06_07465 [Mesorhizobium sp. B4-1-3]|uniref:hypothetical protein n=1 Tax=Mesorhizobium sp. B4-1-3 TaxID=2589889 RepID=UPI00112D6EB0|nr:hypothetical protein [Mesorhizobium sp. B4-1-3]TPI15239.1 hypothetical protein FJW06_07465 [Mesorhizobium sp. B4-1-3]